MEGALRSSTAHAALLAIAATLWPFGAGAAPGDPPGREEARARFERGKEAFADGDMPAALAEFRRAYELAPSYKLLYNIGQVCYQLQDYPCALQSFTRYLSEGGNDIAAPRAAEVGREIDRLRARVARVTIVTNAAGAEITVDDVTVGKTPLAAPIVVSAGRRRIAATLAGHLPAARTIEVAGLETPQVQLELIPVGARAAAAAAPPATRPSPPAPPPVSEKEPRGRRFTPWLWVVPGALAAGGIGLGIGAYASSNDLQDSRYDPSLSLDEQRSKSDRTKRLQLSAGVVGGAALVSAAVLGALILFAPEPGAESARPARAASLDVHLIPGGVSVAGQF